MTSKISQKHIYISSVLWNLLNSHCNLPLLAPSGPRSIVHSSIVPNGVNSCLTSSSVCCLLSIPTKSFRSVCRCVCVCVCVFDFIISSKPTSSCHHCEHHFFIIIINETIKIIHQNIVYDFFFKLDDTTKIPKTVIHL